MFFSNDTRVADTATPNNFVVGSSDPNVGQYGWTKEDRGHYNQLIQYVEECRAVVDTVTAMASYIENLAKQLAGVGSVYEDILRIQKSLQELEESLQGEFRDFKEKYANFMTLYQAFNIAYQDFLIKYQEVLVSAAEAKASADAAKDSEGKAKGSENAAAASAQDAADIAEELRKGQVYRGTWNIEKNAAYPVAPDTNSVWDIVLNEGSLQFSFDGKTWYWGDRLLYLKDDNKFSQIESGSTVVSVNGKHGAVTLTNSDVHAAPEGFGLGENQAYTLTDMNSDPLTWRGGKIGWVRATSVTLNKPEDRAGVAIIQRYQSGTSSGVYLIYTAGHDVYTRYWTGTAWRDWVKAYHTGNKPTASDVGAVNKTGDTMSGPLNVSVSGNSVSLSASANGA